VTKSNWTPKTLTPCHLGLNKLKRMEPVADNYTVAGLDKIDFMECVKIVDFALLDVCPNLWRVGE
jgi:hypothetical protein